MAKRMSVFFGEANPVSLRDISDQGKDSIPYCQSKKKGTIQGIGPINNGILTFWQVGAGLIEILISLVIISVGLLGLAALQGKAQKWEVESYQHSQALLSGQEMVEHIRAYGRKPNGDEEKAWNSTLSANLINAQGCVTALTATSFEVTIIWQGLGDIGQAAVSKCDKEINNGRFITIPVQFITPSN